MVYDLPKVTQQVEATGGEMGSISASSSFSHVLSSTLLSPFKALAHAFWLFSFFIFHANPSTLKLPDI